MFKKIILFLVLLILPKTGFSFDSIQRPRPQKTIHAICQQPTSHVGTIACRSKLKEYNAFQKFNRGKTTRPSKIFIKTKEETNESEAELIGFFPEAAAKETKKSQPTSTQQEKAIQENAQAQKCAYLCCLKHPENVSRFKCCLYPRVYSVKGYVKEFKEAFPDFYQPPIQESMPKD